ncbi:hypothetical protein CRENBAI_015830 [Crenichthys baileyi]|uniref:Uncharacterized protein n=1 Tax=Crenichthys baileyi TaxID=28760 RepID=A0AAV9RAB4_9TELE
MLKIYILPLDPDPKYPLHTTPVQPLPHGGGYQPYNPSLRQLYNPAAVAYNNDQGGSEEDEDEQDAYHQGYNSQYYPQQPSQFNNGHNGYYPGNSEDVELRSPGVIRRFS